MAVKVPTPPSRVGTLPFNTGILLPVLGPGRRTLNLDPDPDEYTLRPPRHLRYPRRKTSRGPAGSKRFFPFQPIDELWRKGDTPLCSLLRCSWSTLRRYREVGLTLDQAERAAEAMQLEEPLRRVAPRVSADRSNHRRLARLIDDEPELFPMAHCRKVAQLERETQ